MARDPLQDPAHQSVRSFLRITGPILLLIGVVCDLVGFANFMMAFGTGAPPRLFWLLFLGMPIVFVGLIMTFFGYMGAITRYQASEVAPVGKDVANYMAEGTKEGVRTVAQAVGSGLAAGLAKGKQATDYKCSQCGHANGPDDTFCGGCGTRLASG